MATLQRIRNRAGLLIALIIGMAIFAFVLQDLMSSGSSVMRRKDFVFAEINGKSISYEEYANRVEKLAEFYRLRYGISSLDEQIMDGVREEAWENLVREYTTSKEYKQLGVGVSTDEVMDMVQGRNPHPIIRQLFADPQTGIINRSFLLQFIRTMDQDPTGAQKTIWLHLENQIIEDKAFSKYNNLIRKGLYVTNLEAENSFRESDKRIDISYIVQRFNTIPDSVISYKESDLQEYYKENLNAYSQTASRDIEYVIFEVLPSDDDDLKVQDWINRLKGEFVTIEDFASLVNVESDIPYDERFYTKDDLSDSISDFMFSAELNDVYGPYFEDNSYRLARLVGTENRPDSVQARHILIQPDQNRDMTLTKQFADSLKNLIDNGVDFAQLALANSVDGSAQDGGNLGWFREGTMVTSFNNACFENNTGDVVVVESQFGYHVIEIQAQSPDVKKVQVAILSRRVDPSSETYRTIYSRAVEFAGLNNTLEKFNAAVSEQDLTKRYASELTEDQKTLPGLESPRMLIRWAFEGELNDVSSVFELGNKFIVACITGVREEGFAPLEQIKNEIELEVMKNKKAEKIIETINSHLGSVSTIEELASKMNTVVQDANGITFSSLSIPNAGMEPNIIGAASNMEAGILSNPIQGNNGVYVFVVNSIQESEEVNTQFTKNRLNMMIQSRAYSEVYEALRDASKIKDNRAKFF